MSPISSPRIVDNDRPVEDKCPRIDVRIDEELSRRMLDNYKGEKTGWCLAGERRFCLPVKYAIDSSKFDAVKTRSDDVWISTFPRSGTTLMQEMVWMILNDCDCEGGKQGLWERSPFFELSLFFHPETKQKLISENEGNPENQEYIEHMSRPSYEYLDGVKSPRVIKTHLPPCLLPSDIEKTNAKVIYIARNPKDVLVSYYHLLKLWRTSDYVNTFNEFVNTFMNDQVPWAPYWAHIEDGWERRRNPNFLFLFYEEITKDIKGTIKLVSEFIEKDVDEKTVDWLANHLDIKNFKNNPACNFEDHRDIGILSKTEQGFIRAGKNKGASEYSEDQKQLMDKWIEAHLQQTDLRFPGQ